MQLGFSGFSVDDSIANQVRAEFALRRSAVIPNFLAPDLATELVKLLETASGADRLYHTPDGKQFASDFAFSPASTPAVALRLLMNDESLLSAMERATGKRSLASFAGHVCRHFPAREHFLDWHSDCEGTRMVGMSVNLSARPYEGGRFRLRRKQSEQRRQELLADIHYTEIGWAHIFEIDGDLEHCVTNIDGCEPRSAFAGWFRSTPDRAAFLGDLRPAEPGSADSGKEVKKSSADRLGRGRKAVFQEVDGEVIAICFARENVARLDPIAADVWRHVVECGSVAQAKGRLAVLYDVNREVLDADVDTVVARLVDAGLLEPR